jgi:hypothetical protein
MLRSPLSASFLAFELTSQAHRESEVLGYMHVCT